MRGWPSRVAPPSCHWRRRFSGAAGLALAAIAALWLGERCLSALLPFPFESFAQTGVSTVVRAADGTPLRVTAAANGERRLWIETEEAAPLLIAALLLAEDRRFEDHAGVDLAAVVRAACSNLASGRVVSGASTLTMQLARMAEPAPRTLPAKLREAFRARQLERSWTKRQILREYLNRVPLGGVSGFEAAAWRWFGRRAGELVPAEAALLVAMLPAPSALAPTGGRATELRRRRDRLLAALAEAGRIDATELAAALAEPLPTARRDWPFLAPWFCDAELARGSGGDGRLDTALDLRLQRQVEASVAAQDDAGVDAVAAVVARRTDGAVVAAVGGREWRADRVDATRRARDAGSTLKPLIAALALRDGVAAADQLLVDAPRALHGYAPLNSDGAFVGAVALRSALPQSRNVPAVTLLSQVGLPAFRELLRALELRSAARAADLTAALGTVALSPREMAFAFTRFADPDARLPVAWAQREEVLRMLAAVPLPGMATSRSIAWKTGTSSGRRDAWCVAVAERHVVVSWLGRLDGRGSADLVGSTAAAPLCARIVAGL